MADTPGAEYKIEKGSSMLGRAEVVRFSAGDWEIEYIFQFYQVEKGNAGLLLKHR